jgi:hypothetical protein
MQDRVTHEEVVELMAKIVPVVKRVIERAIGHIPATRRCVCKAYWGNFDLVK